MFCYFTLSFLYLYTYKPVTLCGTPQVITWAPEVGEQYADPPEGSNKNQLNQDKFKMMYIICIPHARASIVCHGIIGGHAGLLLI